MSSHFMNLLPPDTVRDLARSSSGYRVNRDRAAVMLYDGFYYWDMYQTAKPWLFILSLAGMGASSIGYFRRKGRGLESHAFWLAAFTASATGSYVFRPNRAVAAQNEYTPADQSAEGGFVAALDKKATLYKAKDPKFVDNTYKRMVKLPGINSAWKDTPPMLRALIV